MGTKDGITSKKATQKLLMIWTVTWKQYTYINNNSVQIHNELMSNFENNIHLYHKSTTKQTRKLNKKMTYN
jgi:hypothetical protein